MLRCPDCQSERVVKNGHIHSGKQNHKCRACGRQFVLEPSWRAISDKAKAQIDRLLLEKIPLAGIARAVQVSESWLQSYVNQKYEAVEKRVRVKQKKGG